MAHVDNTRNITQTQDTPDVETVRPNIELPKILWNQVKIAAIRRGITGSELIAEKLARDPEILDAA